MKIFYLIISFSLAFSQTSCNSNSENNSETKISQTIPAGTTAAVDKLDLSKIEISDDSLDLALFNMMLESGKYSEDEIIKNAEILIKKGANPNVSIEYQYSVRKLGTYIPIVKEFYNNKYRHYSTNSTAFLEAINTGNLNIVKKFIELKADVNQPSKAGMYPVNLAVLRNYEKIVDILLHNGADISVTDLSTSKNIDLIEKLVKLGANPETVDINFAISDKKSLERLMKLHPNINKYPLNYSIIFKNDTLLSFLLKNGLNDNATGTFPDKCSPVYGAIRYGNLSQIKLLKKYGFNIHKDCGGIEKPVFFEILKSEKTELIDFYLNTEKVNPNMKDWTDESALIFAVDLDNDEIIKMLLKAGANIEYTGYFGKTPLMHAVQYQKYISAKALIDAGANINFKEKYGKTPLLEAIETKDFPMIKLLVENGADTKVKYEGQSISEFAEKEECPNMIVEYLKSHK